MTVKQFASSLEIIKKNSWILIKIFLVAAVLLDRFEYNILNIIDGCPWSKCIGFVFRNGQYIYMNPVFFFMGAEFFTFLLSILF